MDTNDIRKMVIRLISEAGVFAAPDAVNFHLFHDAAMDSLAFVTLLVRIEEVFGIEFDIAQISDCAQLDRLVELIERKWGEYGHD